MHSLRSLTVVSLRAPPGFPDRLVKELAATSSLERLELRLPEHAWRWTGGLGDIPGLDELVLASNKDPRYPEQPAQGPGWWVETALAHRGGCHATEGQGDARIGAPKRSRPRVISVGSDFVRRRVRSRRSAPPSADELVQVLARSGVRDTVNFVGTTDTTSVAVDNLQDAVATMVAASQRDGQRRHPHGRP